MELKITKASWDFAMLRLTTWTDDDDSGLSGAFIYTIRKWGVGLTIRLAPYFQVHAQVGPFEIWLAWFTYNED